MSFPYLCSSFMGNMEKNYLKYTCIWALIILAGLLLMYFLPGFTVGEHVMRRVDLLGDVRTQKDIAEEPDSLLPGWRRSPSGNPFAAMYSACTLKRRTPAIMGRIRQWHGNSRHTLPWTIPI